LADAKGKYYTLTVSNEVAEKRPDGRDKSTILYEYSFITYNGTGASLKIGWDEFKPMYRGKPKEDAPKLDISKIRRWSFMIRSFFDFQHGDFSLKISSLGVYRPGNGNEEEEEKNKSIELATPAERGRCCTLQ
jgi:hypothetical protein